MWSQESWGENFVIWGKNLVHGVVCVVTKNDDRRQFKGWNVANKIHVQCNRNISPNAVIFSYVLFSLKVTSTVVREVQKVKIEVVPIVGSQRNEYQIIEVTELSGGTSDATYRLGFYGVYTGKI